MHDEAENPTSTVLAEVQHEDPTPKIPPRFPSFDGLRAIAALLVVGVHTSFVTGVTPRYAHSWGMYTARLEIGVPVFFLISGFLLYRPFTVAHLAAAPRPRTGAFWLRRLLRIVPAYWVANIVIIGIFNITSMGPGGWRAWVIHLLFLQIYFPDQVFTGITQAWSLCVEMSFYLLLPLYAYVIGRRRSERTLGQRVRVEMAGLVALVVFCEVWRYWAIGYNGGNQYLNMADGWLPAYLDLFALGMFLAITSAWIHERESEPRWLSSPWFPWASWALAAVCYWASSNIGIPIIPVYDESTIALGMRLFYGFFAFFLLLPAVYGPVRRGLIRRALQCWPVASVGAISYGIYLWHEAWIETLLKSHRLNLVLFHISFFWFFAAVVAMSIASASLSYFIVEKPALRLKNSLTWWKQRGEGTGGGEPALQEEPVEILDAEPPGTAPSGLPAP